MTNTPTRGLNDRASLGPDMAVNWYYTGWYDMPYGFTTNIVQSYYTNISLYASNMFREFKTNGMWQAGWRTFDLDDWWMAYPSNSPSGRLTWNTNLFERGALPISLPTLINVAHQYDFKVMVYWAITTNGCGPNSAPINMVYNVVQDAMSWGADGVKIDHCGLTTSETNQIYYAQYYRIVNQAINDYYAITGATNGTCRPFKILTTGSNGESWPNAINSDLLYGVNQTQIQPGIINYDIASVGPWSAAGTTNGMNMLRDVLQFRPFFRPGHVIYHGIGNYGNDSGCGWTNMLATAALACQPVEAGLGSRGGLWDNTYLWSGTYFPSYSQFWTNAEFSDILQDRLVIPATITLSNSLLSVLNRPLANGDICLGISNESITNKTAFTLTAVEMGLLGGTTYIAKDVWTGRERAFKDSLTWTQGAQSISLFRLRKQVNSYDVTLSPGSLIKSGWASTTPGGGDAPFNYTEGLKQTAGNGAAGISIPLPEWCNSVEISACYYSAFAGSVAWTNTPYVTYFYPTGRRQLSTSFDPVLFPAAPVYCTSGSYTRVTNSFTFNVSTNAPKEVYLQADAGTNASARYIIGPIRVRAW